MKKAGDLDESIVEEERADSECCSGCQSGWTLYLEQSQSQERLAGAFQLGTEDPPYWEKDEEEEDDGEEEGVEEEEEEEEEDDDLSMLSDASSGPPHVHEEEDNASSCCCDGEDGCLCNAAFLPLNTVAKNGIKRRAEERKLERQDSFLDDTASSTLFNFSKATTTSSCSSKELLMEDDHSCCFSATHFKVGSHRIVHISQLENHRPYLHYW